MEEHCSLLFLWALFYFIELVLTDLEAKFKLSPVSHNLCDIVGKGLRT